MPKKFIFLNGPAGSGKDTIARMMVEHYGAMIVPMKFSTLLKETAHTMLGLKPDENQFEEVKETPLTCMPKNASGRHMTPREWYIYLSEQMIKPHFGKEFFGNAMVRKLEQKDMRERIVVFPDSGFLDETVPIVARFGVKECLRIHLSRPEKTFAGDSREYWNYPGMESIPVVNDTTLEDLRQQAVYHIIPHCLKGIH